MNDDTWQLMFNCMCTQLNLTVFNWKKKQAKKTKKEEAGEIKKEKEIEVKETKEKDSKNLDENADAQKEDSGVCYSFLELDQTGYLVNQIID